MPESLSPRAATLARCQGQRRRSARRGRLRRLRCFVLFLNGSNLLYHFPFLFTVTSDVFLLDELPPPISPPEFRGRAIAIFHMNQVLLLLGGMLIGALSAAIGAPWAAAGMSIVGTLCMVVLFAFDPKARTIR